MFDLVIIAVVLLLVFGAGKLRGVGSDLGAAVKGFRRGVKGAAVPTPAKPVEALPDAEFPEVLAAKARRSDQSRV